MFCDETAGSFFFVLTGGVFLLEPDLNLGGRLTKSSVSLESESVFSTGTDFFSTGVLWVAFLNPGISSWLLMWITSCLGATT